MSSFLKDPLILGIESSCDETAAAVVCGRKLLSDEIISSASEHVRYGGVVPEIASRAHLEAVDEVVQKALCEANVKPRDVDAVAVTYGAGLLGALLVGLSFAKSFAYSLDIPLIAVSHIRGHMAAAYLTDPDLVPPYITLLASGAHTAILYSEDEEKSELLASTLDDAAGEAFDKVARILGLEYPGGPNIERISHGGKNVVPLPECRVHNTQKVSFSYSGLKTAVLNYCNKTKDCNFADVAYSFQCAAIDPLVKNSVRFAKERNVKKIVAAGGVAANGYLRETLKTVCDENGIEAVIPEKRYCTDNAAMIAEEGYTLYRAGKFAPLSINASARVPL